MSEPNATGIVVSSIMRIWARVYGIAESALKLGRNSAGSDPDFDGVVGLAAGSTAAAAAAGIG